MINDSLTMAAVYNKDNVPVRAVRHFAVYKNTLLALIVEDKPGVLLSTAAPAPEGPVKHPFVNAQALETKYENEMGRLLRTSDSFDAFIHHLIENGYDLFSYDKGSPPAVLPNGGRIMNGPEIVAAIWNTSGQFTGLSLQPEPGYLVFEQVVITVYDSQLSTTLYKLAKTTHTFNQIIAGATAEGFIYQPFVKD